jgi:hypothetical protein
MSRCGMSLISLDLCFHPFGPPRAPFSPRSQPAYSTTARFSDDETHHRRPHEALRRVRAVHPRPRHRVGNRIRTRGQQRRGQDHLPPPRPRPDPRRRGGGPPRRRGCGRHLRLEDAHRLVPRPLVPNRLPDARRVLALRGPDLRARTPSTSGSRSSPTSTSTSRSGRRRSTSATSRPATRTRRA